jgi:peptide/nickel transport system permease protein
MRYLVRRVLAGFAGLVGVSVVVFILVRLLPGDIVDILAGTEGRLRPEQRQAILREFGLDQPWPVQYGLWVWNMLNGNFGWSYRTGQPVGALLASRLPLTVELAILSVLGSVMVGLPLGVLAATLRSRRTQLLAQVVGLAGLSIPSFWIAMVLIIVASFQFGWLPPLIFVKPWEDPWLNLQQMALPALSLSLGLGAVLLRMTRSSLLEVLGEEYVKVARAKGLAERAVVFRHALRNALIPIITVIGLQLGYLLGGVVITEQVFGLPGIGWTLVNGVYQRDYPVVQGAVMLIAVSFMVLNLMVDLLYTVIDPRIRYD